MGLELDDRQRAMLQEMGVRVWLPESGSPLPQQVQPDTAQAIRDAAQSAVRRVVDTVVHSPQALSTPKLTTPVLSADGPALARSAAMCEACGLCQGRRNSTLQAADLQRQTDWLVVGDPPDEDEDRLGQAFAEQTGVLLDNMLKAVGASRLGHGRQGAHLSNVVKCRPPNGRLPQVSELAQCAHYLQREIELLQPKLILAMGRFAIQVLLQEHPQEAALPLGKQRGQVYGYQGIPVVVTYHPKVLLRASADKAKAWTDLCLAMDVLDGKPTSLQ